MDKAVVRYARVCSHCVPQILPANEFQVGTAPYCGSGDPRADQSGDVAILAQLRLAFFAR